MPAISVSEQDGVRTLTLNRPERRNALTPEMQTELIQALEAAATSARVRVLVLTGAGDAFCAGLDLSSLQSMQDQSPAEMAEDAARIARMFRTLYELPLPTIAVVKGAAIAGGTGLATLCDFTLAVPGAKFGYTETRIGFVPALVSAYLQLQVGEKRARDLLLTARLFSAEEALPYGLVTEVVDRDAMDERLKELVRTLMANSPESLRATKALLADQNRQWLAAAVQLSLEANAKSRSTADFREGLAAFLEKRTPEWG